MSTHNISIYEEMVKIIFLLSSNTHFICSSDLTFSFPFQTAIHTSRLTLVIKQMEVIITEACAITQQRSIDYICTSCSRTTRSTLQHRITLSR